MHDRRRIRDAVTARLVIQCGGFDGRVHPARAGAIRVGEEVPLALVDVSKSFSECVNVESYDELVTYAVTIEVVANGPDPDLADGDLACADALDELCLPVRRALKRDWALSGGLPVVDWEFKGDALEVRPGGKAGAVAHSVLTFHATVVQRDGEPSRA